MYGICRQNLPQVPYPCVWAYGEQMQQASGSGCSVCQNSCFLKGFTSIPSTEPKEDSESISGTQQTTAVGLRLAAMPYPVGSAAGFSTFLRCFTHVLSACIQGIFTDTAAALSELAG